MLENLLVFIIICISHQQCNCTHDIKWLKMETSRLLQFFSWHQTQNGNASLFHFKNIQSLLHIRTRSHYCHNYLPIMYIKYFWIHGTSKWKYWKIRCWYTHTITILIYPSSQQFCFHFLQKQKLFINAGFLNKCQSWICVLQES